MARLLTSARIYQNDPKVHTFCRWAGMVEHPLPPGRWPAFLQLLRCIQLLLGSMWHQILQVRHAELHGVDLHQATRAGFDV